MSSVQTSRIAPAGATEKEPAGGLSDRFRAGFLFVKKGVCVNEENSLLTGAALANLSGASHQLP